LGLATNNKLPISAMIVGADEATFLKKCLPTITFCSEIIYTDLESTDESVNIAKQYGAEIIRKKKSDIPSCEYAQHDMVTKAKFEWILFIDPDEHLTDELVSDIRNNFLYLSTQQNIGAILVPWVFYFKKYKLNGTVWGPENSKYLIVHKNRFIFERVTHYGRKLKPGFDFHKINYCKNRNNSIVHHWATSIRLLVSKHLRYLKNESIDQYRMGVRSTFVQMLKTPIKEFYFCYITRFGYKDLFIGFFLSIFWSIYKTIIAVDLYRLSQKEIYSRVH
jgi:hypothetical protein